MAWLTKSILAVGLFVTTAFLPTPSFAKKAAAAPKFEGKYHAFASVDAPSTYIVRLNAGGKATITSMGTSADSKEKTKLEQGTWSAKGNEVTIKHKNFEDTFEFVPSVKNDNLEGPHSGLRHLNSTKPGSPLEALELFKHPLKLSSGI